MEQHLKQRIVGAIVLVALAVIFIPMLFEERPELGEQSTGESNIPVFPVKAFSEKVLPLPVKEEIETLAKLPPIIPPLLEPIVEEKAVPVVKPVVKKSEAVKPKPVLKLAPSYIVQVGSFGQEKNALQFASRLKKGGYPAFVKENSIGKRTLYRVWVGPELDSKRAEQSKLKIEKRYKLKALVMKQSRL